MIERLAVERFMCESCGKTYFYRGYLSKHVCSHVNVFDGDGDEDEDEDEGRDTNTNKDSKLIIANLLKQNNELLDIIRRQQSTIDALLGRNDMKTVM
jgi:hypothetical protein